MKLLNIYKVIFIFIVITANFIGAQQDVIQLEKGWKFVQGDNPQYSLPSYDDSKWNNILVDREWEVQGYQDYDGYAWYRIKIIIPSSLKNSTFLKDSLEMFLGKIDDCDQSFINGKILGINGKNTAIDKQADDSFKTARYYYNRNRRYTLSVNDPRILWDKENLIAVRVYDQGGKGGIYSGDLTLGMVKLVEYISSNHDHCVFNFDNGNASKTFSLKNISNSLTLKGKLLIQVQNKLTKKIYFEEKKDANLTPLSSQMFSYSFKNRNEPVYVNYILEFDNTKERAILVDEVPYILTPAPSLKPKINGAMVYGQRPGKPFLYSIAATGADPITFEAVNLPDGLKIDKKTGIISGSVLNQGEYLIKLEAKNKYGNAKSDFKIVIGEMLALTPPMGWNSWNCWGLSVDQEKVIASAKVFKQKGLMKHGWTSINIDDGWEIVGNSKDPKRDADGKILCNSKFPNMKALGDSIHALGLKFGIYSSPGELTCGGYTASYQHELQDAQSYASWGVDYLKYDWCSYERHAKDRSIPELQKPYIVMNEALHKIDRDIVYSLCQYGNGNVWEWGGSVGGNLWRTTGDITDSWSSLSTIGFNQTVNAKYAKPGNWNDPDMLVVGWVGWGPSLHPSRLTPDEQYTHISLWSLLSAPLLIGCDLTRLDDFTLNLLTNDEVLALDQDPLGKQAVQKIVKDNIQVWVKELQDGNKAIGVFNLGKESRKYTLNFSDIDINAKIKIRDVWRQKDIGTFSGKYETTVPSHGVILLKVFTK
jgi:alpha-galactosidase